jgi:GDPmannose 4,6-dehydratase
MVPAFEGCRYRDQEGEGFRVKTAVITGVAGQDGSYLADLLLSKGYFVIGIDKRRVHSESRKLISHLQGEKNFLVVDGDITDPSFIFRLMVDYAPDEYYNLAAMSHVGQSFTQPVQSMEVTGLAVLYPLEAMRKVSKGTKLYQASTSELFGGLNCPEGGYDEDSPLDPRSPYAVAKEAAYRYIRLYRESYGLFACQGILFNHESPRRGHDFVTRKITDGVARIAAGKADCITLGNLEAFRDWGHAEDYVRAQWLMLQQPEPSDFVIATGESYSVEDFLRAAFDAAGIEDYQAYVKQDPRFMRPSEVPYLRGNPARAEDVLGWTREYDFSELLSDMVEHDLDLYLT